MTDGGSAERMDNGRPATSPGFIVLFVPSLSLRAQREQGGRHQEGGVMGEEWKVQPPRRKKEKANL